MTPLVVSAVVVSLRATDWRRNQVPRLLSMSAPYDFGEPEQPRAEVQPRALGRIHVDREAHPSGFDVELDDAARLREALAVADGQDRQRLDRVQSAGGSPSLGVGDEQQLADPPGGAVLGPRDVERVAADALAADRLDERRRRSPSSPTMQTTIGAPAGSAGHSVNLAKL